MSPHPGLSPGVDLDLNEGLGILGGLRAPQRQQRASGQSAVGHEATRADRALRQAVVSFDRDPGPRRDRLLEPDDERTLLALDLDHEPAEALHEYGRAIGLAFQITDDILDATSSAERLGKNPSDAELEKSTYVALYGLDEARRRARAEIDRALAALQSAGVTSHTLEIVRNDEVSDPNMVVGSCENGTKKIIYQKNDD